jgi:hypothetical protein
MRRRVCERRENMGMYFLVFVGEEGEREMGEREGKRELPEEKEGMGEETGERRENQWFII